MSKNKKNEEKCCSIFDICVISISWVHGVFFGCLMNIFENDNDNDNYDEDINYGFRKGLYCCGKL